MRYDERKEARRSEILVSLKRKAKNSNSYEEQVKAWRLLPIVDKKAPDPFSQVITLPWSKRTYWNFFMSYTSVPNIATTFRM